MKNTVNYKFCLILLFSGLFFSSSLSVNAQDSIKNRLILKLKSIKIMNGPINFEVTAKSKINGQYENIQGLKINFTNEVGDSIIKLGSGTTNMNGVAKLSLKNFNTLKTDSSFTYNVSANFEGDKLYKAAEKSISFKNANITATISKVDTINNITAVLTDVKTNKPIPDATLNIGVQRLFKNLKIGEDFYTTDSIGTVVATIPKGIPGIDGKLTFEVTLADSDDYGTVIAKANAPLGTQVVQDNDFYKREMWSPRSRTPLFLLIFPNLLTFATWGIIIYLITNLFKINKS